MNKGQILNYIANNKEFKKYSFKLCKGRDIHNDLFQQFFLFYAEKDEAYLKNLYENKWLDISCFITIKNLHYKSKQVNKNINNSNPLFEYCNHSTEFLDKHTKTEKYNLKIDKDYLNVINYLETDNNIKFDEVIILFESLNTKLSDLAKNSGIPYITIKTKSKSIKDKIKKNVTI